MEQGKEGMMVSKLAPPQNPVEQLQARFKELEAGFKAWLSKQSLPLEAAVVTATGGLQGAAIGAFMGTLTNDASSSFAPLPRPISTPRPWPRSSKLRLYREVPWYKLETLLS
ncbi:hypothetical protein NL676_017806 [Syzygium grande]|nr:hypothetical protein NL676_017806 [Syzygium grande]